MAVLQIHTRRLSMRPFTMNEVDSLHRLWTDPQVRKYLWDDIVIPREQAAEVVENSIASFTQRGFGLWSVFPKDKNELIGFCGFRLFDDPPEVEILYGVSPVHWGQGLATEAAQAMLRCGFEEHGFERIFAGADPPNAASFRVMEKCGMTFAKRMIINNIEVFYYVISREAFQPHNSFYNVQHSVPTKKIPTDRLRPADFYPLVLIYLLVIKN